MSQEQTEILQMLAGGAISVEEAERLLNALAEGQKKAAAAAGGGSQCKQQGVQEALHSVREAVAGIGPTVARMVGEISTEVNIGYYHDHNEIYVNCDEGRIRRPLSRHGPSRSRSRCPVRRQTN